MTSRRELTAKIEPFDSFWEAPQDIEKGYDSFYKFYKYNYLKYIPKDKNAKILIISCGPGYFVNTLNKEGYKRVLGIDSFPEKITHAQKRNLNCQVATAFEFLEESEEPYDVIFCEQELNHLTKQEILEFLNLCWDKLQGGGTLIVHALNGANPITGAEALAQNFDHYNTFTEYTLRQVLDHARFSEVRVIPLNLYVFYKNPFNWVAWAAAGLLTLLFRA